MRLFLHVPFCWDTKEAMIEQDEQFASLMKRVLAGDKDAARELHASYGHHILHAVRKRLHHRLRSKFDSIDFVQDVWASFFAKVPERNVFESPEDLIAFLTTMARNKVVSAVRTRMHRKKYNVNRETPLETMTRGADRFPAAQETPSEIMMAGEEWDQFLQGQPLVYRRILLLSRDGKSPATIAEELNISRRTVNRVLSKYLGEDS
jgi:RNA polymerase sigma factor (sigma-70 family)